MLTLYTTEKKLTELCMEGAEWFDIIRNQSEVYICNDSSDDQWDISNNLLCALHKSGTTIVVDNGILADIKKDTNSVLDFINPAFILDFSAEESKKIEEKYGVIFLPSDKTPRPILAKRGWEIDTSDVTKPKTWDYFLSGNKVVFNSLIIVDRYFFSSNQGETLDDSLFNLKSILEALLPKKPVKKLTVTVVFDESQSDCKLQELATKVNKIKKSIIGRTPFTLELLSINKNCYKYEDTHDRFIISNYFVINATHKIKAFNSNKKPLCAQKLFFDYLYSKGIEQGDISSKPEVTQDRVINTLCESIRTSKKEIAYSVNGVLSKNGVFSVENDLILVDET